jgi:glutamate dehydrogenase (NADP+)
VVSGSGNVAEHTARKLIVEGAVVLTVSDRTGYVHKASGLTIEDIDAIMMHKENGASLDTFKNQEIVFSSKNLWQSVAADAYFPCATQNEITVDDAQVIARHALLVVEGANMPLTNEATKFLHEAQILHAPGKASNAGGVAVSGLEMVQNASHYPWTRERVDNELQAIMQNIHALCVQYGSISNSPYINYLSGANIAGAIRVLEAMKKLGW